MFALAGIFLCLSFPGLATEASAAAANIGDSSHAAVGKGTPICSEDEDSLIFHVSPEQRRSLLSSKPDEFADRFIGFSKKVKAAFEENGVVVIRGLFDDDLLSRLEEDAQAVVDSMPNDGSKHFSSMKFGPVFTEGAFREAALSSAIPQFVAKVLLGMKHDGESSLRVLKDAFLCKGGEKKCCGWHVDDGGFWPTNARSSPGVNAWIAIDNIPADFGGGLAVSPKSHIADWRHEAYNAIGSTQTFPEEGLKHGSEVVGKTCDMEVYAPELAASIDGTKKVFNFKKGDVLFHTRWCFHRSMPMTAVGLEHFKKLGKDPSIKRYSIRYEYGSSKLLRGVSFENSILLNEENSGKTLDDVCKSDGPFYPQCWPQVTDAEVRNMDQLVTHQFPLAEAKLKEMFQKLAQAQAATKK